MKPETWKVIALVIIILFAVENIFIGFIIYIAAAEAKAERECYYNFCGEYPDASYNNEICYCYDYDLMGELNIVKTGVLK